MTRTPGYTVLDHMWNRHIRRIKNPISYQIYKKSSNWKQNV